MATQKAKRKRRGRPGAPRSGGSRSSAPRAVRSERREQSAERRAVSERDRRMGERMLGTVGERPPSPFGDLPVSEIVIFAGLVAFVVGGVQLLSHDGVQPALYIGALVIGLGVLEVTAREHFSGFRSHTTLLAAMPAVGVGVLVIAVVGSKTTRQLLLFVVALVFGGLFYVFRRAFMGARQRRVARR